MKDETNLLEPGSNRGLHRFACATAFSTLILIFAGGLVTTTDSGLSVPDWPLSYGQLMPPMVGGIRYEHTHRMIAGTVAILTFVLAIWLWRREPRRWVRYLGFGALVAVILQALLGGITVLYQLPTAVSVSHACLGQIFFCLVVSIALVTSEAWKQVPNAEGKGDENNASRPDLRTLAVTTTGVIFLQLLLGALMRHTDSGLAVPTFPLPLIPAFESSHVAVHFSHRAWACVVAVCVIWTSVRVFRRYSAVPALFSPAMFGLTLLFLQIMLGAFTIWSEKAIIPTTAHVATGAMLLATYVVLMLRSFRYTVPVRSPARGVLQVQGTG